MRGARRTRPARKAKGKVTEEKANMKAKEEDLAAKDSEWRQTWEQEAHTPRPRRIQEREMAEEKKPEG